MNKMPNLTNDKRSAGKTTLALALLFYLSIFLPRVGMTGELPKVSGVSFNGNSITWDEMDGALGYNIHLDFSYLATIIGATEYAPSVPGRYSIVAFDGNGNFSPVQVSASSASPNFVFVTVDQIDTSVPTPENLSGTVYSSTAAELTWEREINRSLSYTIELNGSIIGITEGNRFWIDTLIPDQQNIVSVRAGSASGSTSETVSLAFDTSQGPFPMMAESIENMAPVLASPQDVVLETYGPRVAELFWSRATLGVGISTEVYRDDVLIGVTDGNSFYDDSASFDHNHSYELVTVNSSGDRSAPTYVNPTVFDDTPDNTANTLLRGISEATRNNPHEEWFSLLLSIGFADMPIGFEQTSTTSVNSDGVVITTTEYDCEAGTLTAARVQGTTSIFDLQFDDCVFDEAGMAGTVNIFTEGGLFTEITYTDLEIFSSEIQYLDGSVSMSTARAGNARTVFYDGFEYYIIGEIEPEFLDTYVYIDQRIAYSANDTVAPSTYELNMVVNAPWTNGDELIIDTIETFLANEASSPNYYAGSLIIESGIGEQFLLNASTGSDGTWNAELTANRNTAFVNGSWGGDIVFPCIVLEGACK